MNLFLNNLKKQNIISILVSALSALALYNLFINIPQVSNSLFGEFAAWSPKSVIISLAGFVLYSVALSLFIFKKGLWEGAQVGLLIALIFYWIPFLFTLVDDRSAGFLQYVGYTVIKDIFSIVVPAAILGHMRRE